MHELIVDHGEDSTKTARVVAIEYVGGKPFTVHTCETTHTHCLLHYDFEWSRINKELYWHHSGGGGSWREFSVGRLERKPAEKLRKLWLAPEVVTVRYVGKGCEKTAIVPDADLPRAGYRRIQNPLDLSRFLPEWPKKKKTRNPFDVSEGDIECHYCPTCEDYLPDHGNTWICDHVRWCDECGWYVHEVRGGHVPLDSHDGEPVEHEEEAAHA